MSITSLWSAFPTGTKSERSCLSGGIEVGLHYPISLHLQKAYQHLGYRPGDFPESEAAAESILSLPMFPHITEEQVDHVCRTLTAALT